MNLGKSIGLYTGIGVRNIGMINRLNDTIKLKQRLYALVVPVGIKLGDMQKRVYAALGAEFELFFNYKEVGEGTSKRSLMSGFRTEPPRCL